VLFDPKATCPTFNTFLHRIFDGDTEIIAYVQRCLGYSLSGDVAERAFFVCGAQARRERARS